MQVWAIRNKLIPGGAFLAILGVCLFGYPWEGELVVPQPIPTQYDSIWPWISDQTGSLVIPYLNYEVAHPYLFLLVLGYGLGLWGWPFIRELWQREENRDAFYKQWASAEFGKTKSDFFKFLSRGYESWKRRWKGTKLPDSFNEFVEAAPYPDWLNKDALDTNYRPLIDLKTPYWAFANDLYREVGDYISKRKKPKLLSEQEADEFHLSRQRFAYFWATAARQWGEGGLRYKGLEEYVNRDRRILKALCYMEVILHDTTNQKGGGKTWLFDLCRKFYLGSS
ncbi:MAG: hypothetical protein WD852_03030 [Methyloceanibacter sp.]